MMEFLFKHWDFLRQDFSSGQLTPNQLSLFAREISEHGGPLEHCVGFIDCTIRGICRPSQWQQIAYNGHKKYHALKYSAIKFPDGLIYHLFGPYEGRRNHNALLVESKLLECYHTHAPNYYLYGDSAYPLSSSLLSPFSKLRLTSEEKAWNKVMSTRRESVEWGFGDILRLWRTLDYRPDKNIFSSSIGIQYRVSVLLTNIHICLYSSETSVFINCAPPVLAKYLEKCS